MDQMQFGEIGAPALTDHQVVPLDPFLSAPHAVAIIFNAEIQLGGFPARSHLSLFGYIGMLFQHFSHI